MFRIREFGRFEQAPQHVAARVFAGRGGVGVVEVGGVVDGVGELDLGCDGEVLRTCCCRSRRGGSKVHQLQRSRCRARAHDLLFILAMAQTIRVVDLVQCNARVKPRGRVQCGSQVQVGDVDDVGPRGELGPADVLVHAAEPFAVVVVVGDEEGVLVLDVKIVRCADQRVVKGADVCGVGGAEGVFEDVDLGAGFGGFLGLVGGEIGAVVVRVGEVVDGEDVEGFWLGGGTVDVDAVGDEGGALEIPEVEAGLFVGGRVKGEDLPLADQVRVTEMVDWWEPIVAGVRVRLRYAEEGVTGSMVVDVFGEVGVRYYFQSFTMEVGYLGTWATSDAKYGQPLGDRDIENCVEGKDEAEERNKVGE